MNSFTIELKKTSGSPLYEQLYLYISGEIKSGNLKKNEKLPSKKALASHLRISRNTVETAYSMLAQEGYIYSRPRSGHYVCDISDLVPLPKVTVPAAAEQPEERYRFDFRTNAVDISSFPFKTWAKLNREVVYQSPELLFSGDVRGDRCLRESLAKYLHEFRGVKCGPDQIVIGAGIEYLLTLVCGLFDPGISVAVENPGYGKAVSVIRNSGMSIRYIPLDCDGMRPDALRQSGADIAYITPSHQFPTGIIMPIRRRAELLSWAAESEGRYIIEDDYNSEFNFVLRPVPAVQGLEGGGRVIYMSTFSRTLAPSIRIAYMVLPPDLSARFSEKFGRYSSTVSRFEQHTLCRFIDGGHLSRHLNRVKHIYKRRRDILSSLLQSLPCSAKLKISGENAGLHLIVEGPEDLIRRATENALHENIRVYHLSDYYFEGDGREALVLGYASMPEEDFETAVKLLFGGCL
ncbi:MAG: PLP-dependent aminotransferase family protein [Clostridiales bacterium]|jgi:GntR family transcriptional regulator/MocR family aminotransferase|nr:PLP-dependent aminotransferase family protein [Clostridiales bacterium]